MEGKKANKWCFIPICRSTSKSTPNKIFITVPKDPKRKFLWFKAARRDQPTSQTVFYCCENHFNLEEDVENYVKFKLMGGRVLLKEHVVPHIFDYQEDRKRATTTSVRSAVVKRKRLQLVEEALKSHDKNEESEPCTSSCSENVCLSTVVENYNEIAIEPEQQKVPSTETNACLPQIEKKAPVEVQHVDVGVQIRPSYRSKYVSAHILKSKISRTSPIKQNITNAATSPLGLKMENNLYTDILQICRTCMKEIIDTSFFYLDCVLSANTQLTIRQTLYRCIPELDLNIVPNAVICSRCVDNLLSVFEFKKNCLESEIQISKYIQQVQRTGDLNLVELRFHQQDIKNLDIIEVKIEDLDITDNFKSEDLVCDTSVFNEASECRESTEPKYLLELQKVEIQDVILNTFDDYNISYNLSATEENADTHNSNITQNCLPEVIEHQDNYSKNLNKTNAYYQCDRCGHKAESKFKLILHLKHHTQKNFCHEAITSRRLSRYKNSICYYRCYVCSYLTKYKCLFDFHIRIHLIKKNYKHIFKLTNVHTKAFHTTSQVNKRNIKSSKRKRVKNCNNACKHSFKNRSKSKTSKQHLSHRNSLKPNLRARIVEKLFSCSICEYQCKFKSILKRHILIHAGEKPFSCSVCEYQCSMKCNLKAHMLIHTGEKPFSCSVCEYQCNRKSSLKQHMRIHTLEKLFM